MSKLAHLAWTRERRGSIGGCLYVISVSDATALRRGPTYLHGAKLCVNLSPVIPSQSVGGWWQDTQMED